MLIWYTTAKKGGIPNKKVSVYVGIVCLCCAQVVQLESKQQQQQQQCIHSRSYQSSWLGIIKTQFRLGLFSFIIGIVIIIHQDQSYIPYCTVLYSTRKHRFILTRSSHTSGSFRMKKKKKKSHHPPRLKRQQKKDKKSFIKKESTYRYFLFCGGGWMDDRVILIILYIILAAKKVQYKETKYVT